MSLEMWSYKQEGLKNISETKLKDRNIKNVHLKVHLT